MVMPSKEIDEGPQAHIDGLFSHDHDARLTATRKIKNGIIGNKARKSTFMLLGVIPRLVSLLEDSSSNFDLVYELVVTLGSFSHGTAANVTAVLSTRALPLLVRGLSHTQPSIVSACVRTLRTLYSSGLAPPSPIFDNIVVAKQLVSILSGSPMSSQCAAVILSKACQSPDHQNMLCSLGAIDILTLCMQSGASKSVHSSLCCLSSIIYENKNAANLLMECTCNGQSVVSMVTKILTSNHSNESKLAAAQCLTYLCRAGSLKPDSPVITLKVLPSIMRLCKMDFDLSIRTAAINALAYLTSPHQSLQELSAESDRLIATLVKYLSNRPDENDELVTQEHLNQFDSLCEAIFSALGSLASSREEIRIKVASERHCLKHLTEGLKNNYTNVRAAATRCLHSLTRSTKLLRTSLTDCKVWKPCLDMLSLSDEELLIVSSGVMCNLVLAFSPSRETLVEGGAIERLSILSYHENTTIQLNAVWALMSATYDCNEDIKQRVEKSFGFQRIFQLCSPQIDPKLTMKALGILINLVQDSEYAQAVISNHGNDIMVAMVSLLTEIPSNEIREQVLCVLVNLSCSSTKGLDILIGSDELMRCISGLLHHNDSNSVLLAACRVVKNLADSTEQDHIHRQNCMEEYGMKIALQKLEKNDKIQIQVKEVLEHFMSHSL